MKFDGQIHGLVSPADIIFATAWSPLYYEATKSAPEWNGDFTTSCCFQPIYHWYWTLLMKRLKNEKKKGKKNYVFPPKLRKSIIQGRSMRVWAVRSCPVFDWKNLIKIARGRRKKKKTQSEKSRKSLPSRLACWSYKCSSFGCISKFTA